VSQPKCKEQFESANKTNDTKEEVESKTTKKENVVFFPILQTHPKEDNEKDKDEVERNAKMEMSGDMHIIGKEAQFEKVGIEKNAKIFLQ